MDSISKAIGQYNISNNIGYLGLKGLFFLSIYSYLSSIFLKHNYLHNSLIMLFGFLSFFLLYKNKF